MSEDCIFNLLEFIKTGLNKNQKISKDDLDLLKAIINNPSTPKQILNYIKANLAFECYNKYDITNLEKALSLPNKNIYYKNQEIYKALPFVQSNKGYLDNFSKLFSSGYTENTQLNSFIIINDLIRKYVRYAPLKILDSIDKYNKRYSYLLKYQKKRI